MKTVIHVIQRCIVIEFYKQNAAFFGLILLVFFGFVKMGEHIAIGSFLVANPAALLYLYALWMLYGLKVILFVIPTINKQENQFLESFLLLSSRARITAVILGSFALLIPIFTYSIFLIILAFRHHFFISIASLALSTIIIISLLSWLLHRKLIRLPHETTFLQILQTKKLVKPPFFFFVEHLIRNEIVLLFLTKLYSCAMLLGTSLLYQTDTFDLRLLTTGALFAFTGGLALLHKYSWFQHHQLLFFKNLPVALWQQFAIQSITFSILMIPEMVILARYYPLPPQAIDVTGILLFGFGIYHLIYALQMLYPAELSKLIVPVFWIVILSTFIILFSIHPLILAGVYLLIAYLIIYFRHYRYEYHV